MGPADRETVSVGTARKNLSMHATNCPDITLSLRNGAERWVSPHLTRGLTHPQEWRTVVSAQAAQASQAARGPAQPRNRPAPSRFAAEAAAIDDF